MVNLPFLWRKKKQLGPKVPVVLVDLVVLLIQLILDVHGAPRSSSPIIGIIIVRIRFIREATSSWVPVILRIHWSSLRGETSLGFSDEEEVASSSPSPSPGSYQSPPPPPCPRPGGQPPPPGSPPDGPLPVPWYW